VYCSAYVFQTDHSIPVNYIIKFSGLALYTFKVAASKKISVLITILFKVDQHNKHEIMH
jgi:hypothetical protein